MNHRSRNNIDIGDRLCDNFINFSCNILAIQHCVSLASFIVKSSNLDLLFFLLEDESLFDEIAKFNGLHCNWLDFDQTWNLFSNSSNVYFILISFDNLDIIGKCNLLASHRTDLFY